MVKLKQTLMAAPATFQSAWDSLGRENAAETLLTVASLLAWWTVDPHKGELIKALNFISGDSGRYGGSSSDKVMSTMPFRHIHISRNAENEHTIVCNGKEEISRTDASNHLTAPSLYDH